MDIQLGKDSLFNNWCWQNWTATCKRMKLDCLTPYTKVNLKWIKDLNVSHETINLLEDNRQKSLEYKHEQLFPECISLGKGNKIENEQMGLHHAKNFCTAKEVHQQKKRHPTVWENIFVNDIFDKGLTSNIFKELTHLNTQKANNLIKKWAEDMNGRFSKEEIQMANRHVNRCSTTLIIREKLKLKPQ